MTLETTDTQSQNKSYWISFNKKSGRIIGVTKNKPQLKIENEAIVSDNNILLDIMKGSVNINDYKVKWNFLSEEYDIDKKSETIELQPIANKLEQIQVSKNSLYDISFIFYKKDKKALVSANISRIKRQANISQINSIVENDFSLLNLYVCKKNDPDSLIGTFEIDSFQLLKRKSLVFDLPDFIFEYDDPENLSYFTIPLFEKYAIDFEDDFVVTPDIEGGNKFVNYNKLDIHSQINIYSVNDMLQFETNFHQKDYGIFGGMNTFTILVCNGTPDKLLGEITLNVSDLIENNIVQIQPNFKITDIPIFVYKNNAVSISYNGEKNDDAKHK